MIGLQLPLGLQLRDDATFENFYPDENVALVAEMQALAAGDGDQFLFIWGKPSSGRTHLLQACCQQAGQNNLSAIYFSLRDHLEITPEFFDGLEAMPLICLDDIDAIAGKAEWEEALFHFYNRVRGSDACLVVAGNAAPPSLAIELPDLRSRLAWGLVYQLHELSDVAKVAALQLRAERRGIVLSEEVGNFLINRCARDMKTLYQLLDELDLASLSAQRRLTIPFVKMALNI